MKLTSYTTAELDNHKVLLVGLPKSGKSTLAANLAEKFNIHWIDIERGIKTLTKLPTDWQERINIIPIPDSASYPVASETLMILFKTGKIHACTVHGKNNCIICLKDAAAVWNDLDLNALTPQDIVVLDSVTQLGRSILAHVMRNQPVDYKPERDDWGALRKFTEFFASQFQAARFNLVCICHAVEAELEDNRKKLVPEFGSKGMSGTLAKAFDHVIYCDTRNNKHIAGSMTSFNMSILTGSRTDFDISKLPTPSLIPLFESK